MSLSNGYDITTVLPALVERKGWTQPVYTGAPVLNSTNTTCKSGKPFEMHHAACTIQAIKSTQTYGDAQTSDTQLNTFISNLNSAVCMDAVKMVFNNVTTIDYPQMTCEKDEYSLNVTEPNASRFVGMRIDLNDNVAAQMHSISLMFNGAATFNVYLFNDLKKDALKTQSVTTVANDLVIINLTDWIIRAINSSVKSRYFYIGYFQDDLPEGVNALSYGNYDWSEFDGLDIYGITTPSTGSASFDHVNVSETYQTFGITAEISSHKDFTNVIIRQAHEFDQIIGDLMAVKVLELTLYTTRINHTQAISSDNNRMIYTDVNQDSPSEYAPYTSGLKASIRREAKRLVETFFPKPSPQVITACL